MLAQRTEQERFQYTDEDSTSEQAAEETDRPSDGASFTDSPATSAAFLPASDPASLLIPEIQLPGTNLVGGILDVPAASSLTSGRRGPVSVLPGLGDQEILVDEAARRAARKSPGPPTEVSVFGSPPAAGRSFVFAIDRSKSMGGQGLNALVAARDELSRGVSHLAPQHQFQIIAYNHQCAYFKTMRLIPATDENKAAIVPFIDGLADFGGTIHEMAVRAALAMEPDAVFLLTDGGDPPLDDIAQKNIRKLAQGRTTIHCIQFGFGPCADRDNFLSRLSSVNGGGYTYVDMSRRSRLPSAR